MAKELPAGSPASLVEAFAHINGVKAPNLDELKMMVLLEAAGEELYRRSAETAGNDAVAALLKHNGREEMAHAHRVSKAIRAISGEDYLPPEASDNPYLAEQLPSSPTTAEGLRGLAKGEFAGENLYEVWAANIENEEAARLFRLNGKEEVEHGHRLFEAADLLERS